MNGRTSLTVSLVFVVPFLSVPFSVSRRISTGTSLDFGQLDPTEAVTLTETAPSMSTPTQTETAPSTSTLTPTATTFFGLVFPPLFSLVVAFLGLSHHR